MGFPHAIKTTTANITDRSGAIGMITYDGAVTDRLSALQKIVIDDGYTGKNFFNAVKTLCGTDVEIVKRNQLHTFTVLSKRWIVERSFAWLGK